MVFPSNSSVFPVFSQQKWLKCSFFPISQYFSIISHTPPQKFFEKAPYRATFWEKWRICSLITKKISEFFGIFQNNFTQLVTFMQQLVTFMQQPRHNLHEYNLYEYNLHEYNLHEYNLKLHNLKLCCKNVTVKQISYAIFAKLLCNF